MTSEIVGIAGIVVGGLPYTLAAPQVTSTNDTLVDAHSERLAPAEGGTLKAVADRDNRHVEAGRLLAVIEPSGPEAQLTEAEAGVQQAIAQAEQAKAQVIAARAARDRATAQARAQIGRAHV